MKKAFLLVTVLVVIAGMWLFTGMSDVYGAERDLLGRLRDIATYYASMESQYVTPLLSSPDLSAGDRTALEDIGKAMRSLGQTRDPSVEYDKILALQRMMMDFFATPRLSDGLTSDTRYLAWNRNATNLGGVSALIRSYNESLSSYNSKITTAVGTVAGYWRRWEHRLYIGVDGTTQDRTVVTF